MITKLQLVLLQVTSAFFLFIVGCEPSRSIRAEQVLQVDTSSVQEDIVLSFASPHLERPVAIIANPMAQAGAIFFETSSGRTYLRGQPEMRQLSHSELEYRWILADREILVSIERVGTDYVVAFHSIGGDEVLKWGMNLDAEPEEYFTGLFERTVDGPQDLSWEEGIEVGLNLRGQRVQMQIEPTLGLYAPFYLSSRGYGFFAYGTWPGFFDLCKSADDLVQIQFEGPDLKFKIYTAATPAEIVQKHAMETGPTILPPKWVFRPWRWRDDHTNRETYYDGTPVEVPYNSEVVEDVLMMQAYDIPCGVYWVDRPWAVGPWGYSDFEWDRERLPNPEAMIQWLNGEGMEFLLWIAPWVMGDMAEEAMAKGYNLPGQKSGLERNEKFRVLIDYTNPEAVKWWQEQGLAKVLKVGVKGFKLDRAEEIVPQSREVTGWDGRTAREIRNDYPVQYLKATYDITKKFHGNDFALMPRAGYTGSSRYGVFWGGDIGCPAEGLRAAIIAQLRCAVMGYPIWGSDTGGYWYGGLDREVTARWLAFSCFSPIMEVGPTENRGFWDMKGEPHYDVELIAIWRLYAKIHDALADYSYELAKEAQKTGMPIVRPLFLEYPDQGRSWVDWQTFLYGPDILVSAIWQKGKRQQHLVLPAGEQWRDAWNPNRVLPGGQMVPVDTPLHQIPIFIREGSKIDLGDLNALYKNSLQRASRKPDLQELQKRVRSM